MDFRGDPSDEESRSRPVITRRSCDQCRSRKIGCDRGSPCGNCVSSRVGCTHSAIASKTTTSKQRVLISAQYEHKIDEIAKSVEGIRLLLNNKFSEHPAGQPSKDIAISQPSQVHYIKTKTQHQTICSDPNNPRWDHSTHIIDFLRTVVEDGDLTDVGREEGRVLTSLRNLLDALRDPTLIRRSTLSTGNTKTYETERVMPPLEATVTVLRWVKEHAENTRVSCLAQLLPLERFAEICQKVYFAVDDYTDIDFILAAGFLSNMFMEYAITSGLSDYGEYCCLCRKNLHDAFAGLHLILSPSMETIAALTVGALNAIENSKASLAWTFISTAANFCQTLAYHRRPSPRDASADAQEAQERLFWTVYRIEKGLSLRFGRASNIRDDEITLAFRSEEERRSRPGRLEGKVYDQLYSPTGLARPDDERHYLAESLATELRERIEYLHAEVAELNKHPEDSERDPLRAVHLQCELVCQTSLHALILWAVPSARNFFNPASETCIAVAREVLDIHHQCIVRMRSCNRDPYLVTKYINWALLHVPFVPFNILFTRAVQLLDVADLVRLEAFAASLLPEGEKPAIESTTHPYRLYKLLCSAARLYIDSKLSSLTGDRSLTFAADYPSSDMTITQLSSETELPPRPYESGDAQVLGLGDWFHGNQQLMSLLDGDAIF